jgi:hypothetical protein
MVDPAKVYDGKPCKYGHGTLRWRADSDCVECGRERLRKRYATDEEYRERKLAANRERYENLSNAEMRALLHRTSTNKRRRRIQSLERELEKGVTIGPLLGGRK